MGYHHNWLVVEPPLWKMMELVSWDDDITNIWTKMFQTTKQLLVSIIVEGIPKNPKTKIHLFLQKSTNAN